MYYYLNKRNHIIGIRGPNSQREFDPYRKEERYKAFLRKNYLPITHWNEWFNIPLTSLLIITIGINAGKEIKWLSYCYRYKI